MSNSLKAFFASFYQNTECLILDVCPEFVSGYVKGQLAAGASDLIFVEADDKTQFLVGSCNLLMLNVLFHRWISS